MALTINFLLFFEKYLLVSKKDSKISQTNHKISPQHSRCMADDTLILPFLVLDAEEAIENFTEGPNVVEVVQDDDTGEFPHPRVLTLFCDVGQVLPEFLG